MTTEPRAEVTRPAASSFSASSSSCGEDGLVQPEAHHQREHADGGEVHAVDAERLDVEETDQDRRPGHEDQLGTDPP